MLEKYIAIGAGIALVDHKDHRIKDGKGQLDTGDYPGGVTPNVISTLSRVLNSGNITLFASVGDDQIGDYYIANSRELDGLQVIKGKETGLSNSYFENGRVIRSSTVYNCASDFVVREQNLPIDLTPVFITDLFTLSLKEKEQDLRKITDLVLSKSGLTILNLAGIKYCVADIQHMFRKLSISPNLIFGNEKEHAILNSMYQETNIFPSLVAKITTQGSKGSRIVLGDSEIIIPAQKVQPDQILDEYGAGDCYEGILLASLLSVNTSEWSPEYLYGSGKLASEASSSVIKIKSNRLENDFVELMSAKISQLRY